MRARSVSALSRPSRLVTAAIAPARSLAAAPQERATATATRRTRSGLLSTTAGFAISELPQKSKPKSAK